MNQRTEKKKVIVNQPRTYRQRLQFRLVGVQYQRKPQIWGEKVTKKRG